MKNSLQNIINWAFLNPKNENPQSLFDCLSLNYGESSETLKNLETT